MISEIPFCTEDCLMTVLFFEKSEFEFTFWTSEQKIIFSSYYSQ